MFQSREKLSSFIMWAISAALEADSSKMLQPKESHQCFIIIPKEELSENSFVSKLLRWLSASVILGKLDLKSNDLGPEFSKSLNFENLLSLMDHVEIACGENGQSRYGCEETLASAILYLQQLAGTNYKMLPSVTAALSLLLLDASTFAGIILHLIDALKCTHRNACARKIDLHLLLTACVYSGSGILLNHGSVVKSLWSKIGCPAEANPAWRW